MKDTVLRECLWPVIANLGTTFDAVYRIVVQPDQIAVWWLGEGGEMCHYTEEITRGAR